IFSLEKREESKNGMTNLILYIKLL
ncbi:uncharacterized protein METZ01_LOCUS289628, partial [marine metagenome]